MDQIKSRFHRAKNFEKLGNQSRPLHGVIMCFYVSNSRILFQRFHFEISMKIIFIDKLRRIDNFYSKSIFYLF